MNRRSALALAAEGWNVSDDGHSYTFRLRATARWSNGDRVVAEDLLVAPRVQGWYDNVMNVAYSKEEP